MRDTAFFFTAGRAAYERNDLDEAVTAFRAGLKATPDDPTLRAALGTTLLKIGELNEGFLLFDAWRLLDRKQPKLDIPIPLWRGEDIEDRHILIISEHGFGDQILYARFAIALSNMGARVSWICPPELSRILNQEGISALRGDQSVELSNLDFYCPSSALPLGFDLSIETIPTCPYLSIPSMKLNSRKIGVMLTFNQNNPQGTNRTLPQSAIDHLLSLTGAVNLDPAYTGARDFFDTAEIMSGLDSIISVDTAVANLAGALALRVNILIPALYSDWRWMLGDTTPWYPTARLFRQTEPGNWDQVVDALTIDWERRLASQSNALNNR